MNYLIDKASRPPFGIGKVRKGTLRWEVKT